MSTLKKIPGDKLTIWSLKTLGDTLANAHQFSSFLFAALAGPWLISILAPDCGPSVRTPGGSIVFNTLPRCVTSCVFYCTHSTA